MKKILAGILLVLAGLACLGITTGDPGNPSLVGIFLCIPCWIASGYAFAGRRRFIGIVANLIVVSAIIANLTNASGLRAPNLLGNVIIFFLNGGLSAILTIFAYLAMRDYGL